MSAYSSATRSSAVRAAAAERGVARVRVSVSVAREETAFPARRASWRNAETRRFTSVALPEPRAPVTTTTPAPRGVASSPQTSGSREAASMADCERTASAARLPPAH